MASEVVYAAVSPKERVQFTSQPSDTDDPITYAEVQVKRRSDGAASTPETTHTAPCSENSHWYYVAVVLSFAAVILLIIISILFAVKCPPS